MSYELYTVDPRYGTESRFYDTLDELVDVLVHEGFRWKWSYEQGRPLLRSDNTIAQVFEGEREITRSLL